MLVVVATIGSFVAVGWTLSESRALSLSLLSSLSESLSESLMPWRIRASGGASSEDRPPISVSMIENLFAVISVSKIENFFAVGWTLISSGVLSSALSSVK